jgi:drug/metabolite transporter, DME family
VRDRVLLRGLLPVCLAAMLWGTTGSVATVLVARTGMSPLRVGALRMGIAAAFLLVAARVTSGRALPSGPRWRWVVMGACMAAYQATFFSAVALSGIALAALIAICSSPLLIALLAWALLGERLPQAVRLALGLGVLGTALLIVGPRTRLDLTATFVLGALLALGAGLAYALYVILAKAALARATPLPLAAGTFTVAAIVLAPIVLGGDWPVNQIIVGWPWLVYLGAVATAGAYALHTAGLRLLPASVAGLAALLEPVTATALGVLVFDERLGVPGLAGGALLLAAIFLLIWSQGRGGAPNRGPGAPSPSRRGPGRG